MKKGNFLNYNTLKGRIIFAAIFSILIIISINLIDTSALHNLDLSLRNRSVDKYIDTMSIFVFVNSLIFMLYSYMGVYDAITFITSPKVYSPIIFSAIMIILGILQAFTGVDTLIRLLQMNGLIVTRNANIYSGIYLFTPAIRCTILSVFMYVIRMISDEVMKTKHKNMMEKSEELRKRKKKLEDFLNDN